MITIWLFVWALAGAPTIGGWWLVTMIVAALMTGLRGQKVTIRAERRR